METISSLRSLLDCGLALLSRSLIPACLISIAVIPIFFIPLLPLLPFRVLPFSNSVELLLLPNIASSRFTPAKRALVTMIV